MGSVVNQALRQLAALQAGTAAEVRLPEGWPRAMGYAPWVGEVWVNLLSNAFKYGGSPPRVEVGAVAEGGHVRFFVRDNGEPLSQEDSARVFVAFTRLQRERAEGHGLGLTTVQRIVARLGGTVGVKPGPAGGNEFWFTLLAAFDRETA
jgi:signal transduction histidine kinase